MWTGELQEWSWFKGRRNHFTGRIYQSCEDKVKYQDGTYISVDPSIIKRTKYFLRLEGRDLISNRKISMICIRHKEETRVWFEHTGGFQIFRNYEDALHFARTDLPTKNIRTYKIYQGDKLKYCIIARKKPVTNIDTDEEEQPVPQPKLSSISGGKDGVGNWLIGLAEGSVFTCVEKESDKTKKNYILTQFHVMKKWAMSVYLMSNFPRQQSGEVLVHSLRFSQQNDLIEILQDGESEYVERSED